MTTSDKHGRASLVVALALVAVLLPFTYVLSIGPAARVTWYCYYPMSYYYAVYGPLYNACDRFPVLDNALESYINLWLPPTPPVAGGRGQCFVRWLC